MEFDSDRLELKASSKFSILQSLMASLLCTLHNSAMLLASNLENFFSVSVGKSHHFDFRWSFNTVFNIIFHCSQPRSPTTFSPLSSLTF